MNKTKKLLIDITFDSLYRKGYCATGLMDILKNAKLTKGAMYYHFENKNDLVLETMQYYLESILEEHWIRPLAKSQNPLKTLIDQINTFYNLYESEDAFLTIKHGCPLNNFVQDMSDKDEKFFEYLYSVYDRWQKAVERALIKAQELKQTKTDFNPKQQALFIISAIEGSLCSSKAYNDLDSLKQSFEVLNTYIEKL